MGLATGKSTGGEAVGEILRRWRSGRKMSQMELALSAGVSNRHLSFVETGRSQPSRELVLRLCEALALPLRQRNALLAAAGYAAEFGHTPLDEKQMSIVQRTLRRLLEAHEPCPALVLDSGYDILMVNQALRRTLRWAAGEGVLEKYDNIYRLIFARDGLHTAIVEWPMVARFMLARLLEEAAVTQHEGLLRLHAACADLLRCTDSAASEEAAPADQSLPILSLTLEKAGRRAVFFSTITTFGTPLDVTTQELRIETFFPGDEATRRWLESGG